jgi:hypothetical protein
MTATATAQPRRCGACGALGHNARTCPGDGEGRAIFRSASMPSLSSMRRTGSLDNLASVVDALGEDDGEEARLEATEEEEAPDGQQLDRERKKGASPAPATLAAAGQQWRRGWLLACVALVPTLLVLYVCLQLTSRLAAAHRPRRAVDGAGAPPLPGGPAEAGQGAGCVAGRGRGGPEPPASQPRPRETPWRNTGRLPCADPRADTCPLPPQGDWRGISRQFVTSRTPTQVASHAQKYFIRQNNLHKRKRRSSLFDIVASTVRVAPRGAGSWEAGPRGGHIAVLVWSSVSPTSGPLSYQPRPACTFLTSSHASNLWPCTPRRRRRRRPSTRCRWLAPGRWWGCAQGAAGCRRPTWRCLARRHCLGACRRGHPPCCRCICLRRWGTL